ncbi:signal transduction histidine kinase [Dongia mobilis]|uniref:histidine kinase n=1 Tax=Dongia mobilis TaxID=578943 RepID=A0A4R6WWJ4_9PROT|nr:HAMP domain-containing sensor histidine kinase [Dongia mobilis]TDQ83432.1 signal transduction histidine kinase [Dongia mobilis]
MSAALQDNSDARDVFAAEPAGGSAEPWQILIVDDDQDVHLSTEFALGAERINGRGLSFLHAYSAAEAQRMLAAPNETAVILLDVVMETDDAGLQLVRFIRDQLGLSVPRIILRTGHPGYAPERDVIRDYDIDDYRTKSELSRARLFTSVATAIRAYDRLRQLQEANNRLEAMTRDLEILNVDYLEQREAAMAAAHAKSRFLANVSHELRTPLNAIIGFSELSLRALDNGEKVPPAYLQDVLDAGRRLAALVDDILEFSQLDSRRRRLVWEPTDLKELLEYQCELYTNEAARLGITLVLHEGAEARSCELDRSALSKVLGHVIANALRYSPKGASVDISWRVLEAQLHIEIGDRGPGVPGAIKSNLDQPFSIGQEVLTKDASGLGLGLTICRHLMTMMGGRIAIADREGGGTTVSVILPSQSA